jgi:serine carboxypeptidase-like clade IV
MCIFFQYYDVRKKCEGTLCYDFSKMDDFLNDKSVREALGVGNRKFVSCSPLVYEAMIADWMKNLEVGIPELIEDGIKLLIYAGEYDLICNWLGMSILDHFLFLCLFVCHVIPLVLLFLIIGFNMSSSNCVTGNYRWVNSMKWSGSETFVETNMTSFTVDGEEAGLIKSYGPLSFLKVRIARRRVSFYLFACSLTSNKCLFFIFFIWLI